MLKSTKLKLSLLILVTLASGCASLRTEFYRSETRYIYNRGCQHYRQGDYDAAREDYKKVLSLDPDYGPAYGALGNVALTVGSHEAALAYYRRAIQVDPKLENALRPFFLVATVQTARAPIIRAGTDLRQVFQLIMAAKQAELEALLSKDIPLDLLAKDTLSITPSELGELQNKVVANADPLKGSARSRLLSAYLLFYNRKDPVLAATLIEQAVPDAENEDRKRAYVILGQIRERLGDFNLAVDAYFLAVNAGVPLADVANHLSRIYGLDVDPILLKAGKPQPIQPSQRPLRIDLALPGPKPPALQMGSKWDTLKNIHKINKGRLLPEGLTVAKRK